MYDPLEYTLPVIARKDVPEGENLCEYCTARCCRYFALPIDTPEDWDDFDNLRWYIMHGRVSIFVDDGTWYLMIHSVCENLQEDYRCGIYETRPNICRAYTTDDCEYDNDTCYDMLFECEQQVHEYAEALLPPRSSTPL